MRNKFFACNVFIIFLLFSCKGWYIPNKENRKPEKDGKKVATEEFVVLNFPTGGITIPIGTDDRGDDQKDSYGKLIETALIERSFEISKYETTFVLWKEVYEWAIAHGYKFLNAGRQGSSGKIGIKGDDNPIPAETDEEQKMQPVVQVSWYDCILLCNARSEKEGREPVYYFDGKLAKDAKAKYDEAGEMIHCLDRIECKSNRNGYRLPTSYEWELCARTFSPNEMPSFIPLKQKDGSILYFGKGRHISGSAVPYADEDKNNADNAELHKRIKEENDKYAVYGNYWDGKTWKRKIDAKNTQGVAGKKPNSLGLYDMSGNVAEWCFDLDLEGKHRFYRGGAYHDLCRCLQVGVQDKDKPDYVFYNLGFRFVRGIK